MSAVAVGIGDHELELGEIGVAGVELAVVIGIEDVLQGLHVGGGAGVPIAEDVLVGIDDGIDAIQVDEQHGIAGTGPGGAVIVVVLPDLKMARRGQLRDVDALPKDVEHDGADRRIQRSTGLIKVSEIIALGSDPGSDRSRRRTAGRRRIQFGLPARHWVDRRPRHRHIQEPWARPDRGCWSQERHPADRWPGHHHTLT